MKDWFHKVHHTLWFKVNMVEAYLAYNRGEMVLCATYEARAAEHERQLIRLAVSKRFA